MSFNALSIALLADFLFILSSGVLFVFLSKSLYSFCASSYLSCALLTLSGLVFLLFFVFSLYSYVQDFTFDSFKNFENWFRKYHHITEKYSLKSSHNIHAVQKINFWYKYHK